MLPSQEWDRLSQLSNLALPNSNQARIIIAEEGDKIVGVCVLELTIHLGPLWVDEGYRSKGILQKLLKQARKLFPGGLRGAVCFTDNPKVERFALACGWKRILSQAFKWEPNNG
jgi:GNAT superfamily N-acetyltransferase